MGSACGKEVILPHYFSDSYIFDSVFIVWPALHRLFRCLFIIFLLLGDKFILCELVSDCVNAVICRAQ